MDKTCFVIMPISDADPYPVGHFKRVYEYLIKPACLKAGFNPLRADDILTTNYIALDVIKRIINSDMAICDMSSRNPNVFYELGIRQSFNLPVTLIRDSSTNRVFDIQGFRDIEYDKDLRIDSVELAVNQISETLKNTYQSKTNEVNSLVSLLGMHAASISTNIKISTETELILTTLRSLSDRIDKIEHPKTSIETPLIIEANDLNESNWENLDPSQYDQIKKGDYIRHHRFGIGRVDKKAGAPHNPILYVVFPYHGEKALLLNYIRIDKLIKDE